MTNYFEDIFEKVLIRHTKQKISCKIYSNTLSTDYQERYNFHLLTIILFMKLYLLYFLCYAIKLPKFKKVNTNFLIS